MKDLCTVYLPSPGVTCCRMNGARVVLPDGREIPNIRAVEISAIAGNFMEVTIRMSANVETVDFTPDLSGFKK